MEWKEKNLFRIIKKIGKRPLVLYGAGKYGKQALENIRKYFPYIEVKYFIDDDRVRNREAVQGLSIKSLEDVIQEFGENFCILITNYYISEVLEKIERIQFDLSNVYFDSEIMIEDIAPWYLEENIEKLQETYILLEDYKSKMIFRAMAEARFTKNIDVLCQTCDINQYFPKDDIFSINEEEVFVDAGAFDGDTIEQFLNITHGKCRYIYAFEPDKKNYNKLRNCKYDENIRIYNAGLYDETKKISFSSNKGGSSKIVNGGEDIVQVYQFDELELPDKEVTFIKMDIEGSEGKALKGMKDTICKFKPKLAICIYHRFEDLWELPLYIKKLVPEYKLYIRNYTTYLDEIVLYATI